MPHGDTFSVRPIGAFVAEHLVGVSADPFARNYARATYTNDINPATTAQYHMDAVEFLEMLGARGVKLDTLILDPPYSPRQISECYKAVGLKVGMRETQNARLYKEVKDAALPLLTPGARVLSFGWNSAGMGNDRGFEIYDALLVCHGAAHNDTICIAERRAA